MLLVGTQNDPTTSENSLAISYKVQPILPAHPHNSTPRDVCPKEIKICVPTNNYPQIFLAALFIMAQTRKNADVQ